MTKGKSVPLLVAGVTALVFLRCLFNGFVDWDDPVNLVLNPHFRGFSSDNLLWMFTTFREDGILGNHFMPLTWMSYALDYLLWGMRPAGYHLTNILLHSANAALLCLLIRELLHEDAWFPAGIGALFFSLHPLRVESVAWATERRDVLSGFFILLSLLAYLRGRRSGLALYALSLLSKATAITYPFVLMLLDGKKRWERKVPYLALAVLFGGLAYWMQARTRMTVPMAEHGVWQRLAQSGCGLMFYLWKTVVPLGLSPLYERARSLDPFAPVFLLSMAAAIGITLAARRRPGLLTVWAAYALTLSPFLGIVAIGPHLVADRYSYIPCMSLSFLVPGLLRRRRAVPVFLLAVLAALTWRQCGFWRDSEALWRRAVAVAPDGPRANWHLAKMLEQLGDLAAAEGHCRKALASDPLFAEARLTLGVVLAQEERIEEAAGEFEQVVKQDPDYIDARVNLAAAYLALRRAEGIAELQEVLRRDPGHPEANFHMGNVCALSGRYDEALARYRTALVRSPDNPDILNNLRLATERAAASGPQSSEHRRSPDAERAAARR